MNLRENFLNTFQLLSPKQQKIWRYLQYCSNTIRQVFPSQQTIANKCGCHRSTVNVTIGKFFQWGWLVKKKRCYRSNVYFVNDELKAINTYGKDTFLLRVNATTQTTTDTTMKTTTDATLYKRKDVPYIPIVRQTSNERCVQSSIDNSEQKQILMRMGFAGKDLILLSHYSLASISLAAEDYQTRKSKDRIINKAAWFTHRCKAHSHVSQM
jgi:hypothetical protein